MLQQVRECIKILKEQLIKDWCIQSWSTADWFGTPMCSREKLKSVQKRAARFVTLSSDLLDKNIEKLTG